VGRRPPRASATRRPIGPDQHRAARTGAVRRAERRVKLVTLTPKGAATKAALLRGYHAPPPELSALDTRELATLAALVEKLQAHQIAGRTQVTTSGNGSVRR
jgi:hypothetical protein